MGSTDIMSGSEEKMQNASPAQGTGTQDKPRAIHRHFGPFPSRPEKVFHTDFNGRVKMGYPLNMGDFDGEIISPLPREMYPQHLFFGDPIWPSHSETTDGKYRSHISGQISETYMFVIKRFSELKHLKQTT